MSPRIKKFLPFIIVGSSVVLIIGIALVLWPRLSPDKNEDTSSETTSDEPSTESDTPETLKADVELDLVDYPTTIETSCDRLTFTVSVENTGEVPIQYSEITGGKFNFSILVTNINAWSSARGMQVSDFGTLEIGDSKEITLTGGEDFSYDGGVYHENNFHGPDDNGTFKMKITFDEPSSANQFSVLGETEAVDLTIDIYEDPDENLLKSCGGL